MQGIILNGDAPIKLNMRYLDFKHEILCRMPALPKGYQLIIILLLHVETGIFIGSSQLRFDA